MNNQPHPPLNNLNDLRSDKNTPKEGRRYHHHGLTVFIEKRFPLEIFYKINPHLLLK